MSLDFLRLSARKAIIDHIEYSCVSFSFNAGAKIFCDQARRGELAENLTFSLRVALERHRKGGQVSVRTIYNWKKEIEERRKMERVEHTKAIIENSDWLGLCRPHQRVETAKT